MCAASQGSKKNQLKRLSLTSPKYDSMSKRLRQNSTYTLLIIVLTVTILYYGRGFLIPLSFGAFLAMVFHPLTEWIEDKGMPRWISIGSTLLIFIASFCLISGVLVLQTRSLVKDWPKIQEQLDKQQEELEQLVIKNIGIVSRERVEKAKEKLSQQQAAIANMAKSFLGSIFSFFTGLVLAVVYMVFIMIIKERLMKGVLQLISSGQQDKAHHVMHLVRQTASEYLIGRLLLIGILSVFYAIGFLIFGLQYAIPIAILAAVLSIIPYIGNIIGGLFALALGIATGGGYTLLFGIIGTMTLAQILESNVLTPWIMSREVNLNPLTTFTAIIAFSLIWGVAGSILAIPIVGAAKKIFDHIDGLKSIGFILGSQK